MKLTIREAKLWLLAAATACVKLDLPVQEGWCLEALEMVQSHPTRRRRLAAFNDNAADHNRLFGTPESKRDARILCFCAAVLRAVDGGR